MSASTGNPAPPSPGARPRALIIEDDLAIAELERDYLEAAGFSADVETNGASALERAILAMSPESGRPYDLFVVDLMLPGADGFTICRELRERSEKPVLVVSARSGDIDKVRALGIGADDYITKPFSPAELVARARAHLDRYERLRGESGGAIISSGDLVIDTEKKAVSAGGQGVQLTATEYAILLLLARNPGRVYSREEIFEAVRGEGTYGEVSTVTVHMRRLREKIEADPSNPKHIETVWGMGYRFVE
ncbi:MAG TPA: response regulator transcription factor [Rectinemataceae bacterium]|nr:response regulator transcription factor [Rectinemataceae bacterium]